MNNMYYMYYNTVNYTWEKSYLYQVRYTATYETEPHGTRANRTRAHPTEPERTKLNQPYVCYSTKLN